MGFEMVARLSCEANHQNNCITKQIVHHCNPTTQKPKGKCHTSLYADHPNHPVTFQGGFSFTEPGKKIVKLWWEGGGPSHFIGKRVEERICVWFSCLFLNVYACRYFYKAVEKISFFRNQRWHFWSKSNSCLNKASWKLSFSSYCNNCCKQHSIGTGVQLVLCYSVLHVSFTVTLNPSNAVTLYTWKMSRSLPSEYFCTKRNSAHLTATARKAYLLCPWAHSHFVPGVWTPSSRLCPFLYCTPFTWHCPICGNTNSDSLYCKDTPLFRTESFSCRAYILEEVAHFGEL